MAGLMKEILLDYGMNTLSTDQRNDIIAAISGLQSASVVSNNDLRILDLYIAGYTAPEIAAALYKQIEEIELTLHRVIQAIEHAAGYTDEDFINKLYRNKYAQSKIIKFKTFIDKHGRTYMSHDVNVYQ